MTVIYGMMDLRDTQLAQDRLSSVGVDRLGEWLANELAMYNAIHDELIGKLSFATAEFSTRYGRQGDMVMLPAEEYSRVNPQRVGRGYALGLPLKRYQIAVGWTKDFLKRQTVGELVTALDAATGADIRNTIKLIKQALFGATNYTFHDEFKGDLGVKRLLNADSTPIPSFDGATFNPATHTHYLYTTGVTLADTDVVIIEGHLLEHGHSSNLVLYINPAQEATVRARADFTKAESPFLIQPNTTVARVSNSSDFTHIIGRLRSMEVRKRNWMPAGYYFAFNEYGVNSPLNPLARRLSDLSEDNAFHLAGTDDRFPLETEWLEHWMGFGGYNRSNGVIMYEDSGNGDAYVVPTFS